jgi:hypothetical protein
MSNKKDIVFCLIHMYEVENEDEIKELGIYSSREMAEKAIERYFKLPGFCEYSISCFKICEYIIDEDSEWTEGFINTNKIAQDFEKLTLCFNEWLGIKKTAEESWEDGNYYNALCEINYKISKTKDIDELASYINSIWSVRFKDFHKNPNDYIDIAKNILSLGV